MTLRGRRVGSSDLGPHVAPGLKRPRGPVQSQLVSFWCFAGHTTTVRLSADVEIPQTWQCGNCGEAAGPDRSQPPPPPVPGPANGGRTPLDYLHMRRSPEDGERALAEALDQLRARREAGQV